MDGILVMLLKLFTIKEYIMTCLHCPCAYNEESEKIQNLGCLPTTYDLFQMQRGGKNWACHEDDNKPCAGFVALCKEYDIKYDKSLPLANYTKWYQIGNY